MRLSGKVAMVTGASRGIGEAIARRFAGEGAFVFLVARGRDACERIAMELGRDRARASVCDATQPDSIAEAVDAAGKWHGRIDILVNNAGASGATPLSGGENVDRVWSGILETSLTSAFRMSREALPWIPDGGRIINQSSVLGRFGVPGYAAYTAAKHGIIGLTRTMALELAPRKITVNAICPGWVETQMARDGFARIAQSTGKTLDEARSMAGRMAPLGAILEPEEIAGLAVYLASEEARNLTGQAIVLDGGQVMP